MKLTVVTPTHTVLKADVSRIVAEGANGSFGVLERHIDFAIQLKPGVLVYDAASGTEGFIGLNWGTFVKRGSEVMVSTHDAVAGHDLAALEAHIEDVFLTVDEEERRARLALARLEAGMIRRFIDLREPEDLNAL